MPFSHYEDDAKALIRSAYDAACAADEKEKDRTGLRIAAERGWLALSSAADRVANKLNLGEPGGFKTRWHALREAETSMGLTRGTLTDHFSDVQQRLHGALFHGNDKSVDKIDVVHALEVSKQVIEQCYLVTQKKTKHSKR